MPRKSKIKKKEIEFSDGKSKENVNPDINDILGFKEKNHFGTSDASQFEQNLEAMSLSELQSMAVSASIFPSGTKVSLKNKLKKAFKQMIAHKGRTPVPRPGPKSIFSPDSEAAKKFIEIMNG